MSGRRRRSAPARRRAAGAVLAAALAWGAGCSESAPPRGAWSALLVTLDTTRRDALGCYGAAGDPTPNLDRLAREGIRATAAYTVAPLTLPSHASMLTGLVPPRHGVRDNGLWALSDAAPTLAEAARAAGLDTAAFVGALVLDERFGLDQGFDVYRGPSPASEGSGAHFPELPAREVVDRALDWLDGRDPAKRFFLWVHLFDPHGPHEPPEPFAKRFPLDPYLAEVASADHQIGRLLDGLRDAGELERTFVLFVADHGEAFGEHGEMSHGAYCWETTLRVPLLLRHPDGRCAGTTLDAITSVVDVAPTLADAMGIAGPEGMDGVSLYGRAPAAARGAYFESYDGFLAYGWSPLVGWIDADAKYLHSSEPQLFDVRADPGETRDLVAERPRDVERARAAIAALVARSRVAAADGALDGELVGAIRGLGYAAVAGAEVELPPPLAPSDRPSPQSRVEEQERCVRALGMIGLGLHADAERLLANVLEQNPDNAFALDRIATCRMRLGRPEEAIEPLTRLVERGAAQPGSWFNLGECLAAAGRADEALGAFERAAAADPRQPVFLRRLAEVLAGRGEDARAAELRARVEALEAER